MTPPDHLLSHNRFRLVNSESQESNLLSEASPEHIKNLIIVVRADPIICGHSTEARNLAEAAHAAGLENIHIVSYPIETLENSGLPLKPLASVQSYSHGISIDRPEPIGDYKVLDGRLSYAISGHIISLINQCEGPTAIMDLYLIPHGMMVMNAANALNYSNTNTPVYTIAEAVGSDITNVINAALSSGNIGTAQLVLSNYLDHDIPVAVSEYTRKLIIEAGQEVDAAIGTNFEQRLKTRVKISYPAIDTAKYVNVHKQEVRLNEVLTERGLDQDGFVLFLSRLSRAKGVDDLIHAYRASDIYGKKKLVICGNGPESDRLHTLSDADPNIMILHDVSDEEKALLMHACYMYCLPSKPMPEFTETFGIAIAEKMLAGGLGPVVTTQTGGIPEATGGHCIYHSPGSVDDLTRAINDGAAMSPEQRKALADRAREYAMQFDRTNVFNTLMSHTANKNIAVA